MPSIALPVSLRGQLLNSVRPVAPFTPSNLFAANEPGVWYDPSDVANLNWRRNLLTWTEQFDNAAWVTAQAGKSSTTEVVAAIANAPLWRITEDTATNRHEIRQNIPAATIGQNYVLTVYAKEPTSNSRRYLQVFSSFTNDFANFDLQSVTVTAGVGSITPIGSGVYRLQVPMLAASAGTIIYFALANSGTLARAGSYTGDGVSNLLITGAQLELGSTATDYQRITDVNTEVVERFPTATLYQDTAGTQPVTTPGQTVALALDKSKGLVLGPELVTNGDFATDTVWIKEGGATIAGGLGNTIGASSRLRQDILTVGKFYQVTVTISNYVSGGPLIQHGGVTTTLPSANGTYTRIVQASGAVLFAVRDAVCSWDNISVRELPGFHATQATAASRPTYGIVPDTGRRNLLERTEEFDNAYWSKAAGSVTANAGVAPNGTTTADKFIPNTSATGHSVGRIVSSVFAAGGAVTFSCRVKADPYAFVGISIYNQAYTGEIRATFNLTTLSSSTATLGTAPTGIVATITDAGNGWRALRVSCTFATGTNVSSSIDVNPTNSVVYGAGTAGDGTSGILIWGAQLETGSTATAYQRVGSAFDVTEAGVASLSYLSFDGVDDFLVTPTITPGTDKAQVFAGVRKLSDAAYGCIAETSAGAGGNAAFAVFVDTANTGKYYLQSGSLSTDGTTNTSTPAPATDVLAVTFDRAGATAANRIQARIDGSTSAITFSGTGAQTGNFGAFPMYIGRRNGSTLPFNGQIYSMIVRFGTNLDAGTITSTETWVNGKTGAYA